MMTKKEISVIPDSLEMFLRNFGIKDTEENRVIEPCMEGRNWKPPSSIVFDEHGEPNF